MIRKSCAKFLRSRLVMLVLPVLWVALAGLPACDKNSDQPERRYCDSTGCYACNGDKCYPVAGEPSKPDPGKNAPCDNDAACGAGKLCNLGTCTPVCTDNSSCASGQACIAGRCRPGDSAQCGVAGARCTTDAQCSADQSCVNHACATRCPASGPCALGQICQAGSCVEDPQPKTAQCVFDTDCGVNAKGSGFRCVNSYCLPTCTDSNTCTGGASCVKGLCRGSR